MKHFTPLRGGALALLASLPIGCAVAAEAFSFKSGFDYRSGKQGGGASTDITTIPLTATGDAGNWPFKASVPQPRVAGLSNVIPGVGSTRCVSCGMLGSSAALSLKNAVSTSPGVSWQLSPQASVGLIADHRMRSLSTGHAQRELTAFYSRKLADKLKLQAYAVKGYSNGSPYWGGGVVLVRGF